jgi:hypothetical protein
MALYEVMISASFLTLPGPWQSTMASVARKVGRPVPPPTDEPRGLLERGTCDAGEHIPLHDGPRDDLLSLLAQRDVFLSSGYGTIRIP